MHVWLRKPGLATPLGILSFGGAKRCNTTRIYLGLGELGINSAYVLGGAELGI